MNINLPITRELYGSISVCSITSRLNIRTNLSLGICIVCYSLTISFVKSENNLVEFKKKGGNAWRFHLFLLNLQQVFEEMQ